MKKIFAAITIIYVIFLSCSKNSIRPDLQTAPEIGFNGTLNLKKIQIDNSNKKLVFNQTFYGNMGLSGIYNFMLSNDTLKIIFAYRGKTYREFINYTTQKGQKLIGENLTNTEGFTLQVEDILQGKYLYFFQNFPDENENKIEVIDVFKENISCTCDESQYWITYKLSNFDEKKLNGTLIIKIVNPCCL